MRYLQQVIFSYTVLPQLILLFFFSNSILAQPVQNSASLLNIKPLFVDTAGWPTIEVTGTLF
jgi:hypothetical protein